jgi:Tfp pilus assembly protein PilX
MKPNYQTLTKNIRKNQQGMASVISTLIIVILLSLICVGFAKIMNRSLQESLSSNLASAANYVAQSGVNDAISYIKVHGKDSVPEENRNDCSWLKGSPPKKINYNVSSDNNVRYTCILINPKSYDLVYQVQPYVSQIANVSGASKILLSWDSATGSSNNLPAKNDKLLDETTWGMNEYPPVLRLTLYPIQTNLFGAKDDSRTYFLYPAWEGTESDNSINFQTATNGSIQYINCNNKSLNFTGSIDRKCNVVITTLPTTPPTVVYARLTPLYSGANIVIKGNDDSNKKTQFYSQTTIDVTAQSGSATKRLQVRISEKTDIPEYALRTTNLLCKRLTVVPPAPYKLDIDSGTPLDCAVPVGTTTGG